MSFRANHFQAEVLQVKQTLRTVRESVAGGGILSSRNILNNRAIFDQLKQWLDNLDQLHRNEFELLAALYPDVALLSSTPVDSLVDVSSYVTIKGVIFEYLARFSTAQPDLVLMCLNAFRKDLTSVEPRLRQIAVRYLSEISHPEISVAALEACQEALNDRNDQVVAESLRALVSMYRRNRDRDLILGQVRYMIRFLNADRSVHLKALVIAVLNEIESHRDSHTASIVEVNLVLALIKVLDLLSPVAQIVSFQLLRHFVTDDESEYLSMLNLLDSRLIESDIKVFCSVALVFVAVASKVQDPLSGSIHKRILSLTVSRLSEASGQELEGLFEILMGVRKELDSEMSNDYREILIQTSTVSDAGTRLILSLEIQPLEKVKYLKSCLQNGLMRNSADIKVQISQFVKGLDAEVRLDLVSTLLSEFAREPEDLIDLLCQIAVDSNFDSSISTEEFRNVALGISKLQNQYSRKSSKQCLILAGTLVPHTVISIPVLEFLFKRIVDYDGDDLFVCAGIVVEALIRFGTAARALLDGLVLELDTRNLHHIKQYALTSYLYRTSTKPGSSKS